MLTYEDLEKCGDNEDLIARFIYNKIEEQKDNPRYLEGVAAGEFFRDGDPYMKKYEKIIYDMLGKARREMFSANHKLTAALYSLFVMQEVSYLLGNGVSFDNDEIKKRLGNNFDYDLQDLTTWAANDSESYALLKEDGIEKLNVACDDEEAHFIPIFSADNRVQPKAGIKHWRVDKSKPLNVVLYRADVYSEWQEVNNVLTMVKPNQKYWRTVNENAFGEVIDESVKDYATLPIIPLWYPKHVSAIHNKQETLSAYNLVLSGMINNTTELNLLYWVIKNADGMSDLDYEDFITNLYKSHVLPLPDGVEAEPHEVKTDPQAHESVLQSLRTQLFQDFKAVDTQVIQGGNKTTVEIKAAYENLNLKCDELEKEVGRFIQKVLVFYGFSPDEGFHFHRPQNINLTEYMTMLVQSGAIFDEETLLKLACEAMGMIDQFEEIMKRKQADELNRMLSPTAEPNEGDDTE